MSRIRSIKPEFWTSEQILECSANARLLFIGLWNFCDDDGRHPYSARQAKAEVFPADDLSERDILRMLAELEKNGLITRYESGNKEYFYVNGWKHQRIDKPQAPKYPDPFADNSKIIPGTIPPDTIGEDKKGEDTNIRAVANATRPSIDADFFVFKETYPKRLGSNPWQPAERLFTQAVRSGHDPMVIIRGVRAYHTECENSKIIGTEKVAQAQTWLRQSRFLDYTEKPEINHQNVFVPDNTAAGEAWTEYEIKTFGRKGPRKNDGWWRATEFPPGYKPKEAAE